MNYKAQYNGLTQESILLILFFLSGSSALIYQVIWQKLLFSAFGVNIQSVSIIVSTFMLGLGAGALVGGQLAERYKNKQIIFFIFIELGIGLFGFGSYSVIRYVGTEFVQYPLYIIGIVNFIVLLFPAMLMGATLPILVAYLYKRSGNVGTSIGKLYFSNTCGAALGSFLAGFVLLIYFQYDETLYFAATSNLIVAFLAYYNMYRRE